MGRLKSPLLDSVVCLVGNHAVTAAAAALAGGEDVVEVPLFKVPTVCTRRALGPPSGKGRES